MPRTPPLPRQKPLPPQKGLSTKGSEEEKKKADVVKRAEEKPDLVKRAEGKPAVAHFEEALMLGGGVSRGEVRENAESSQRLGLLRWYTSSANK